jgi:carboxymethylenebutenolidase
MYAPFAVTYPSGELQLGGYLFTSDDPGSVPALLFHHGSGGLRPHDYQGIATLRGLGYTVFVPLRRGHHGNPGGYWLDHITHPWGAPAMGPQLVAALEAECEDVLSALRWLQGRPEVDSTRVSMCGHSYGGVMIMLAAARTAGFRAGVSFAGPSQSWPEVPLLREMLCTAMRSVRVPLFLLQAANDHSLLATYTLAAELFGAGKPHEVRIYPPVGTTALEGHGLFGRAPELWQDDVARFLRA